MALLRLPWCPSGSSGPSEERQLTLTTGACGDLHQWTLCLPQEKTEVQVSPPTPNLAEACEHAAALAWQAGECPPGSMFTERDACACFWDRPDPLNAAP